MAKKKKKKKYFLILAQIETKLTKTPGKNTPNPRDLPFVNRANLIHMLTDHFDLKQKRREFKTYSITLPKILSAT